MRAASILPAGTWDTSRAVGVVLLDFDHRHRRRIMLRTDTGTDFLLDLPAVARMADGDGLVLDDGDVIRVRAQPERLLEIHVHTPSELARIAWHLGNRHLPVQMTGSEAERLRIREDHVIADLIERLGGHVTPVLAPFDPETGAYAGRGHSHHHHDADD